MTRHVFAARLLAAAALPALAALGTALPGTMGVAQAQQLTTLPNVADLADKLLPAVVEISVESKVSGGATVDMPQLPDDSPFKDFFDDFFKKRQGEDQGERTVNSMGSGFIIDASGIVVTNNHVVEGAQSIQIRLQDGTTLKAELKGRDPKTDLAVLTVKPSQPLPTVSFGDSDHLRIGEWVMAIGNPFGLGGSVSLGIVSARNRDINAGPYDDFIQTDAAINKGNSGGPLFNMSGQVVGINTAIFSPTGGSVGIGFSVPANTARGVVDQLWKYGETRRGWFGVKVQTVTDDIAESMGLGKPHGALVADVVDGSPGKAAGVEAGDVIVEFDGKPIREMKELTRTVAETEIGKKVKVKVIRKGKDVELQVAIGRLEDVEKQEAQKSGSDDNGATTPPPTTATLLGMTVSTMTDDLRSKFKIDDKVSGAIVTEVAADGAAADKQIEAGDVIMEAGGKPVTAASDVSDAMTGAQKAGKSSVLLLISKAGKAGETRFIALKVK
ncbi:Do family serine endopeptidase [Aestuariivirga sp.]|uniref:Do family serine endopeptidase n=1 Tax=Aestuariivirga sp. TaxID=2650926 RepID=UPI0039E6B1CD